MVGGASAPLSAYRPDWLDPLRLRLAVVGADGFIGSHVVSLALAAGAHVDAICLRDPWRLRSLQSPRLELGMLGSSWWQPTASAEIRRLAAASDAAVLLAYEPPPVSASAGARLAHERRVNVSGCIAAAAAVAGRVVFASSADVYGSWCAESVREDVPPAPATPYAEAKLEAEGLLVEGRSGGEVAILRLATVFGPGEHSRRAIPAFLSALLRDGQPVVHGDGNDVRDYVHVGDVAAAILNAASRPPTDDSFVLNVGSGVGRSTLSVLAAVEAVVGVRADPRHVPTARPGSRLVLDPSRARLRLGFRAREDFVTALVEEAAWLRHSGPETRPGAEIQAH